MDDFGVEGARFRRESERSCPHAGQDWVLIGLYVSHCPQAIPISRSITIPRPPGPAQALGAPAPGRPGLAKPRRPFFTPGKTRVKVPPCGGRGAGEDGAAGRAGPRVAAFVARPRLWGGAATSRRPSTWPTSSSTRISGAWTSRGALQFTALGATEMLDRELELTKSVRGQGYTPGGGLGPGRLPPQVPGDARRASRFDYDIDIKREEAKSTARPTSSSPRSKQLWKVVRVEQVQDAGS